MVVWLYDRMTVWMYGCMDVFVWMYSCMDVWLYGCMVVWSFNLKFCFPIEPFDRSIILIITKTRTKKTTIIWTSKHGPEYLITSSNSI